MDNGVYRIVIKTEDWSEGDTDLMERYGEPEINLGGTITYIIGGQTKTKTFGDEFVRVLHGFPYSRGFDSRDYASAAEAVALGVAWKETILSRLDTSVTTLRANTATLPTEEVTEI